MKNGPSIAALVHFLGPEMARTVFAHFSQARAEQLAIEAVRVRTNAAELEDVIGLVARSLTVYQLIERVGVPETRQRLSQHHTASQVDRLLGSVQAMFAVEPAAGEAECRQDYFATVSPSVMVRALAFLSTAQVAVVLRRHLERVSSIVMAGEAAGLLEHLGAGMAELDADVREEMLDIIAADAPALATRLQVHLCGLVNLLDLDYDELADILGGAPVEDIALALMAAEPPIRERCFEAMDGVRGAMVEAHFESPVPVCISEIDAASQRLSCMVGSALDGRLAPTIP